MAEEKGSTVKMNFEVHFENVDEAQRQKLMEVHDEADVTKMVRSLLAQDDEMPTYTRVIWGQWQELASS